MQSFCLTLYKLISVGIYCIATLLGCLKIRVKKKHVDSTCTCVWVEGKCELVNASCKLENVSCKLLINGYK